MSQMKSSLAKIVTPVTPPSATLVEKIPTTVYASSSIASQAVAQEIAELIRDRASKSQPAILGLATGSTPTAVYAELIRLHREEGLSFKNVITFNLDEYYPMKPDELQSYHRFMHEHLFDHVDIDAKNIHIPSGTVPLEKLVAHCQQYEQMIRDAGGIDLQVLGIGRTGHIGFNEPGSPRESRTRAIVLDHVTRTDASNDFFGLWNVPRKAITMGVESIMSARKVILMAWGEHKASVIRKAVEGEVTSQVSASFLQAHTQMPRIVLDPSAAADLTRFSTPWLIGSLEEFNLKWDAQQTRRAVVWLAQQVKKPLLKLTDEDYNEHGLQELIASRGGAYDINIEVFKTLQNTISGWPGGKAKEDSDHQPIDHASDEFPKRVIVFSPHPDDDVISMGGTYIRLCDQKHDVHVAYQTSGNIAVFDDAALRHADFVAEYCKAFKLTGADGQANKIEEHIEQFVKAKKKATATRSSCAPSRVSSAAPKRAMPPVTAA